MDRITFDFHMGLPHIVNAVLHQVINFAQRVTICATERLKELDYKIEKNDYMYFYLVLTF